MFVTLLIMSRVLTEIMTVEHGMCHSWCVSAEYNWLQALRIGTKRYYCTIAYR